jgi:hypothetical protein
MSRNRHKEHRDKREPGGYVALPHAVLRSEEFSRLSPKACKLLMDLLAQYRGNNNGDLCAAWTLMKPRGWTSKDQLGAAIREVLAADFAVLTRQGGKHKASLYAVTFYEIDWCGGKLDMTTPNRQYMGEWRRLPPKVTPLKPVISLPRPAGQWSEDCPARRVNSEAVA